MNVDIPTIIFDDGTVLEVVRQEIEWLKLEAKRTKCHHIAQMRVTNERHVAEMENLQWKLVVVQIAPIVLTI